MGWQMKEEGKWCETSVIIIMIEKKKIRQTSLSIASHSSFCRGLEHSNVK